MTKEDISALGAAKKTGMSNWDFVNHAVESLEARVVQGRPVYEGSTLGSAAASPVSHSPGCSPALQPTVEVTTTALEAAPFAPPELEQITESAAPIQVEEPGAQPTEEVTGDGFNPAKYLLGQKGYSAMITMHGADKVKSVCDNLCDFLDKDEAKALVVADAKGSLFKQTDVHFGRYRAKLSGLLYESPSSFSVADEATSLLPGKLNAYLKKRAKSGGGSAQEKNQICDDICQRTGYDKDLVIGLMDEGHDVYFLEALTKYGFDLDASPHKRFVGKNFPGWKDKYQKALRKMGVGYNSRLVKKELNLLTGSNVIEKVTANGATFSSDWADVTKNTHLNTYFKQFLAPRNGDS